MKIPNIYCAGTKVREALKLEWEKLGVAERLKWTKMEEDDVPRFATESAKMDAWMGDSVKIDVKEYFMDEADCGCNFELMVAVEGLQNWNDNKGWGMESKFTIKETYPEFAAFRSDPWGVIRSLTDVSGGNGGNEVECPNVVRILPTADAGKEVEDGE